MSDDFYQTGFSGYDDRNSFMPKVRSASQPAQLMVRLKRCGDVDTVNRNPRIIAAVSERSVPLASGRFISCKSLHPNVTSSVGGSVISKRYWL